MTQVAENRGAEGTTLTITLPRWLAGLAHPVIAVAVLLILLALGLRIPILLGSYFVEDDFLFQGDAYESGLTFDFMFRVHKGHLMPGALALTWVLARISAYNWALVASVTFAAQVLVSVMTLRLLVRLFGVRPGILIPLAIALFSPLTFPAFGWWSAAINAVPLQLGMVMALSAQVRYVREGQAKYARRAFLWVLFAMAFSTKGVFVPFVLFAVTTGFLRRWAGGWIGLMLREARQHWRLWGAYLLLIAGYTALYLSRRDTAPGEGATIPDPGDAFDLVTKLLGSTFPAGIVGGPLSWGPVPPTGGMANPSGLLIAVAWTVIAALVIGSLIHRRRAGRAWVLMAGYLIAVDAIPTAIARGTGLAQIVGAETRYVADAVIVFALCLALAYLPQPGEPEPYRRPLPTGSGVAAAAGVVAGVYLVTATVSIQNYRDTLSGDRVRAYLANVRAALAKAPDDTPIYSSPLPEDIVLPWNGNRRYSHRLLAPLARPTLRERMRAPEPSEDAVVFDEKGRLVPVSVQPVIARVPPPGRTCFPLLGDAIFFPDVPSFGGIGPIAGLAYSAKRPVTGSYEIGEYRGRLTFRATESGLLHFPVTAPGKGLLIRLDDPAAPICLKGFAFGDPVPMKPPAGQDQGKAQGQPAPTAEPSPAASPAASPSERRSPATGRRSPQASAQTAPAAS
ncbi:hypothetical protein TBS_24520 [Thermobispora bispora]|uniref:hypothetical protein n=1 Tax=Thermobispora bispora TaxID=2006 RepID=UPI0019804794|nr:hypothetical protein [Thermobispora bispora]MBO2472871.1 hypothetical protein [Actinomycetales bacterium]MDI9580455.1 hypothetical protein [Thermobispora sp.]QSI47463.1 hypothetical protein CYL17_05980 [Thermobispora bispora]